MSTLKEIKGRIASVRSTLKITSAMKMVSSAKLHRAQQAIGNMVPYEEKLKGILAHLLESDGVSLPGRESPDEQARRRVALVCVSSNSSLCGSFNANVLRQTLSELESLRKDGYTDEDVDIYCVGKKVADVVRKAGRKFSDWSSIAEKPSYHNASELARTLVESYNSGKVDKVLLVYNHMASTASQPTLVQTYLPITELSSESGDATDYILEPDPQALLDSLLPKVMLLKMYTVLLDANAAEHAARTVAMQMASDNADKLLSELSLEYNKRRQQAITNELLDLAGGLAQ